MGRQAQGVRTEEAACPVATLGRTEFPRGHGAGPRSRYARVTRTCGYNHTHHTSRNLVVRTTYLSLLSLLSAFRPPASAPCGNRL